MTDTAQLPEELVFDMPHGRWRITGTYASEDNITIYRDGELYRRVTFPAYKIWNIPAHLDGYVEALDREVGDTQAEEPAALPTPPAEASREEIAAELDRLVEQNREWRSTSKGFLAAERAVHDYWTTKLTRRAVELRREATDG